MFGSFNSAAHSRVNAVVVTPVKHSRRPGGERLDNVVGREHDRLETLHAIAEEPREREAAHPSGTRNPAGR